MRRKKNSFFTFIWSFMPGAAEMYMGFMKCGLSLMLLFFGAFALPFVVHISNVLLFVPVLVWFYAFFHARNLAACTEETLQEMEDAFVWDDLGIDSKTKIANSTARKWGAIILIVIGASMLWHNFRTVAANLIPDEYWEVLWPFLNNVPELVISVLIIVIGMRLIVGKKKELADGE